MPRTIPLIARRDFTYNGYTYVAGERVQTTTLAEALKLIYRREARKATAVETLPEPEPEQKPKRKRTYKRRDLEAETTDTEE